MKIIMIGPFPPPINGMSLANNMLFEGLIKRGTIVKIIDTKTSTKRENLSSQGKISIRKVVASIFPLMKGTLRILFGKSCDIVYITPAQNVNGYLKYVPFMWAARVRKIPYVIHIHGGYFRKMYDSTSGWKRKIIDKSLNGLAGAIVLGPSLRYMFEGLIPNEKIFVCENGVEDEIFATEEEIKDKIEHWKNDDTIRIVYLSNLLKTKGILDLLEAVKILKNEGKKVHLDVAGAIEPEIRTEVEKYFSELKNVVTYHGVVNGQAKKKLLLDNYIFCLPSNHPLGEGQPISILEAMANGCAIVTTDHGGIKDIVLNSYGVFVEKENSRSTAHGIEEVFKSYEDYSYNAWMQAKDRFSYSSFVRRIEAVFDSVLKNREQNDK